MFKVLYAYNGWTSVNYVLNNVRDPVRTLKIAGPLGLGICAVLYVLANVSYFSYVVTTHHHDLTLISLSSGASKEDIQMSGVTVASLFFGNVFGAEAQKALTVFVALRWAHLAFSSVTIINLCEAHWVVYSQW